MKKVLAIILATMVLFGFGIVAYADLSYTASSSSVNSGENVVVTITNDAVISNISAFEYRLSYDNSLLEFVSATVGNANAKVEINNIGNNYVKIALADTTSTGETISSGVIGTITFKVKEVADKTATQLELTKRELIDTNWEDITGVNIISNVISLSVSPKPISVTGITLSPTSKTIEVGESFDLETTVTPDNATNKAVNYSVNGAAKIEDGKVTGLQVGKAIITATTVDGEFTATCNVEVVAATCKHTSADKTEVPAKPATCTEDGNEKYYTCKCGVMFDANGDIITEIPKIGSLDHDWNETTYNHSADGKTCTAERVCKRNGDHKEYATATISSAEKTPATCVEEGWTTYTATFSEKWAATQTKDVQDIAVNDNHVGKTEVRDIKEANCHEKGHTGNTYCLDCNTKIADGSETKVDSTNHVGGTEKKGREASTCTKQGHEDDTYCKGCDTKIADGALLPLDKNNHVDENGAAYDTVTKNQKNATCKDKGYTGDKHCKGCDTIVVTGSETALNASNHVGGTEVRDEKEANCHEKGHTGNTYCKGCDTKIEDGSETEVDSTNHVGGTEKKGRVASTCTKQGHEDDTYCLGCDTKIADGALLPLDKNNHVDENGAAYDTVTKNQKNATCKDKGYTGDKHCKGCDTIVVTGSETALNASNHAGGTEVKDKKEANCHEKGHTGNTYCKGCDTKIEDGSETPTNPNNHHGGEVIKNKVEPDCANEKDGYTGDTYCKGCDTKIKSGSVDKYEHDWGAWVVVTKPTTTAKGLQRRECERTGCEAYEEKEMPKINYDDDKDSGIEIFDGLPGEKTESETNPNTGAPVIGFATAVIALAAVVLGKKH